MEFLGKIGIDPWLLLAQIINFVLLLLLLNKFLYKPIVARIEADENELKAAETEKNNLEKERKDFLAEKNKELAEAKEKSKQILAEAAEIARGMQRDAEADAKKDADRVLKQAEKQAAERSEEIKNETAEDFRSELKKKITAKVGGIVSKTSADGQKALDKVFFDALLKKIKQLPEWPAGGKEKKLSAKLEYARLPDDKMTDELVKAFAQKSGREVDLVKRKNGDLVAGFRVEAEGFVIDSNLIYDLLNLINA
jgi:F-type H+-transporting ATPase subunit b